MVPFVMDQTSVWDGFIITKQIIMFKYLYLIPKYAIIA